TSSSSRRRNGGSRASRRIRGSRWRTSARRRCVSACIDSSPRSVSDSDTRSSRRSAAAASRSRSARPSSRQNRYRSPIPIAAASAEILVEELQRALPRELGRLLVVPRRRVVVEAVLRAFVDEHLVLLVVRLQRRLE